MRYTVQHGVAHKIKTSIVNTALSFLLLTSGLSGSLPLLLTRHAFADSPTTVTPASLGNWQFVDDNGNGGNGSFVSGPGTPPLGNGSAQLGVSSTNQGYLLWDSAYGGTKLSDISTFDYSTYVQTGNNLIAPSAQVNIDKNVTDGDTSYQGRLVYEPYMNGTVQDGQWQTWHAASGKWWLTKASTLFGNNCGQSSPCTFSELTTLYPDMGVASGIIAGLGFKAGSSWSTFVGNIDNFTLNSDTYDFEPVLVSPCVTTTSVVTTDLSTWNLNETRSAGHNELTADGLHIYTDDSSGNAKAAGYYATNFALSDTGTQNSATALDYAGTLGSAPGLQMVVDLNNDNVPDGILVGEGQSYPSNVNDWWFTGSMTAPHTGTANIFGHPYGSLNEWLAMYPNAQVTAIGYSLGSGIQGDGVIKRITLGCTNYTFQLAPPAVPTNLRFENPSIPCGGSTNINQTTSAWDAVAGAASYDYHVDGPNGLTYDANLTGTSNTGSFGAGDEGTYTFKVRSVSSGGAKSDWSSSCSITYDPTAPTTPTLLTPPNGSYVDTNDFYFTWTSSTDNSPVTYEFLASQNPHTTGGVLDTGTWDNIANGNSEQNNLTTPQIHSTGAPDGDWFWQVRAIDAAGNKSNWTGVWKVTIDTQTPQVPTNLGWKTSTNVTVPDNGSTNVVDGTASWQDSSSDIDHYVYKYWNDISGNPYKENSPYTTTTGSTSLYGVFNQGEGVHHFAISACDAAGHCSAFSAPFTITYDASAPTGLANVSPNDGTHTTTANQSEITWTNASDVSGAISYYYESSHSNATQGDGSFASPVYQSGALSTNSINTPNTPAGTYYWHVRACDTVGNCSAWTNAWQLIVDNTAPHVTINSYSGTDTTPTVTGTVDDPTSSLTLKVDSGTAASATNNGDGTWTYTLPTALSVGSHTLEVTATDTAGNHSTATATATVQAPAASVQGLNSSNGRGNSNNAPGHQPTVTITPNNTGQVLGATTTDSKKSDVKGASTTKTDEPTVNFANANDTKKAGSQSAFLMLGWWWLLVVAGVLTAWWLLATRRGSEQN